MHRARYLTLAAFASGVGRAASIALTASGTAQLTYTVPAGHWVGPAQLSSSLRPKKH